MEPQIPNEHKEFSINNLKEFLMAKPNDVTVMLDKRHFILQEDVYQQLVSGESPLNRLFIEATPLLPKYGSLVKWPFCKPRVIISNINKNYFFKRFAFQYFTISDDVVKIQAHTVKDIVETECDLTDSDNEIREEMLKEYKSMFTAQLIN